ncbi:MAG: hypothetical protein K9M57_09735, partial [Phycisphaerae bacterium]|nr:hypothetical protein [Phycisphaerae bacterium]
MVSVFGVYGGAMVERVVFETLNCRAGLMTPRGVGGIAVVRVCGSRWREVLDAVFFPVSHHGKSLENNELRFGKICD